MIVVCPSPLLPPPPPPPPPLPLLCFLSSAVLVTVPIGDDRQLMSCGSGLPPVLWLSTNAGQLTIPMGDALQLMSSGSGLPTVLWLSTNAFHFFRRLRRARLRSSFAFLVYTQTFPFHSRSSDFSAPLRFLFSTSQQFSSLSGRWGCPTAR